MKISIIITEGAKQIMMTPETRVEKEALKFIAPSDTLKVVNKNRFVWGHFSDENEHVNYQISKSQGGYYRAFETRDSLMFIIEDEPEDVQEESNL